MEKNFAKYIQFDRYFQDVWPYDLSQGVGMKLTGVPTDSKIFLDIIHDESCNPIAARRILTSLQEEGVRYTTVQCHLNFNYIGDELKKICVKMEIVAPAGNFNTTELDRLTYCLAFNKENSQLNTLDEASKKNISDRFTEFKKSMATLEHDFGPFDPDDEKAQEAIMRSIAKVRN